ncbi:MAG: glycerate kinase [Candidatus Wallbacteria bacterium]
MKILIAPDSFKGTLTSKQAGKIIAKAANKILGKCEIRILQIADGGEGTLDAVSESLCGRMKYIRVKSIKNPLLKDITARYGIIGEETAFIEMAAASGLTLIPYKNGNAMNTSSYGTGQLIADALKKGCRKIYVAIGGSATNDGGIGMMSALGVKFLDESNKVLQPIGRNLIKIREIDITGLDPLVKKADFIGLCDVTNPLTGPNGATFIFGPQKGANGKYKLELEKGMVNYANLLNKMFKVNIDSIKGSGAAGGLGAALVTFLNAELKSGIETIFKIIEFEGLLKKADLVVTGEGKIDSQSANGKVLAGIGRIAKKHSIPVLALAGSLSAGHEKLYKIGITAMESAVCEIIPEDRIMKNAAIFLQKAAERAFTMLKTGNELKF